MACVHSTQATVFDAVQTAQGCSVEGRPGASLECWLGLERRRLMQNIRRLLKAQRVMKNLRLWVLSGQILYTKRAH